MRRNAVAEAEDVPRRCTEGIEHAPNFLAHARWRRAQYRGVEIALQRDFGADSAARIARIHAPIESDRLATARGDALEPIAAALGEDDARDVVHLRYHLAHVGQRELLVLRRSETPAPG